MQQQMTGGLLSVQCMGIGGNRIAAQRQLLRFRGCCQSIQCAADPVQPARRVFAGFNVWCKQLKSIAFVLGQCMNPVSGNRLVGKCVLGGKKCLYSILPDGFLKRIGKQWTAIQA